MEGVFTGQCVYEDEEFEEELYDDDHILSRRHPGCTLNDLDQQVSFLRPHGDEEGKDVGWCLGNDFREIEEELWSGPWCTAFGYEYPANESQDFTARTRLGRKRQSLLQSLANPLDRNVDTNVFQQALSLKKKGNASFGCKKYEHAIQYYKSARNVLGIGPLLSGEQREEYINVLSNIAECYLRLEQYMQAGMAASEALALDGQHEKSLLRRAKASYRGTDPSSFRMNPFALCQVEEDLDKVIRMGGQGAEEALQMKEMVHEEVKQQLSSVRSR